VSRAQNSKDLSCRGNATLTKFHPFATKQQEQPLERLPWVTFCLSRKGKN
jgi:hypothetical protein